MLKLITFCLYLSICGTALSVTKDRINVTYMYVNLEPYEQIVNQTWKFVFGRKGSKTLYGILSRSLNFIINKHCPQYRLQPKEVSSFVELLDFITAENYTKLREANISGEHFIMGPLPMHTTLYYRMHYYSHLFTWQDGFAESEGIILVRRLDDVDLSKRIIRAIKKSKPLLCFVAFVTFIIAAFMWVIDRDWKFNKEKNNETPFRRIFNQIYWALITTVSTGPADSGPHSSIGKLFGALWLMVSLITVSCMTSIITSDMVDSHVTLANKTVGIKAKSWEELIGRMLINHYRSNENTVRFWSYMDLLDGIKNNQSLFAGLIDYNVAATLQSAMRDRDLGN